MRGVRCGTRRPIRGRLGGLGCAVAYWEQGPRREPAKHPQNAQLLREHATTETCALCSNSLRSPPFACRGRDPLLLPHDSSVTLPTPLSASPAPSSPTNPSSLFSLLATIRKLRGPPDKKPRRVAVASRLVCFLCPFLYSSLAPQIPARISDITT